MLFKDKTFFTVNFHDSFNIFFFLLVRDHGYLKMCDYCWSKKNINFLVR